MEVATAAESCAVDDCIAEALRFLELIFDRDDWIEVRLLPSGQSRWFQLSDLTTADKALRWAMACNARERDPQNVYYGVNPRDASGKRSKADVPLARVLFADFDDNATVDDVLHRIDKAGLPAPSIVVVSGGGVHVYWLLDETVADLDRWTVLMKGIIRATGADKAVHDAPRIMRMPSTRNVKPERPGRPWCRLVMATDTRHSVNAFILDAGSKPQATLPLAVQRQPGTLCDIGRRFMDTGHVDRPRRENIFTICCDMQANGWTLDAAMDAIMSRVHRIEPPLTPEQIADLPRQIRNAFKADREPGHTSLRESQVREAAEWQPFPVELLPAAVRDYVTQTAEGMACDPTLVAIPMLAAVAAAIGNTRVISLKSDWQEPAILWAAIIAESGSLKTPAMRKALQFVNEQEREIEQRNAVAQEQYEEDRVVHESQMAAWKQQARRHGDDAGRPPAPPRKPLRTAHVVSDCTIEAVAAILADNPRGVLLERDELSGWLGGFDRYKAGGAGRVSSEVGHWLSMHNASPLRLDRKSTGRVYVERASLSIAGGIQPDTLVQAIGHEHVANGLLARFLLVAPPRRPKRFNTNVAGFAEVEATRQLFRTLHAIPMHDDGPVPLTLSRDAEAVWATWDDAHAVRQNDATGVMASMLSKIEAAAARLALIHYVCRQATDEPTLPNEVDVESVNAGIRLAEWFAREWQRVYEATIGGGPRVDHDGELLAWVEGQGGEAAVREIGQRMRRYRDAGVLERTIKRMVQAGRIETFSIQNERGGPPAEWVRLPSRPAKPR